MPASRAAAAAWQARLLAARASQGQHAAPLRLTRAQVAPAAATPFVAASSGILPSAPAPLSERPDLTGISSERSKDGKLQYRVDVYTAAVKEGAKRVRKYVGKYSSIEEAVLARDTARAEAGGQLAPAGRGAGGQTGPRYYGVTKLASRSKASKAGGESVPAAGADRWQATAPKAADEKPKYIGCFATPEEAATAVDNVRRGWGATAGLNFPQAGESGYERARRRTAEELAAVPHRTHKKRKCDGDAEEERHDTPVAAEEPQQADTLL